MPEIEKEKKYEIINTDWIELIDTEHRKHILRRIRAVKDFDDVKIGDYGGYIESENNLNQYDNSWIYSDAVRIDKNARAWGQSRVYGNAKLYNSAEVCDYAIACDHVKIYDNSKVHGRSKIYGNCYIHGISNIGGRVNIFGDNLVHITGGAKISDNVKIKGTVTIKGNVFLYGNTTVIGNGITIDGDILIREATNIRDEAHILSNADFSSVTNLGVTHDVVTSYLTKDLVIMVNLGEFTGTYDKFTSMIKESYNEDDPFGIEILHFTNAMKERFVQNRGGNNNE